MLRDAIRKHGNPSGRNSMKLTVWPNHHLKAELAEGAEGTSSEFDKATIEAYNLLNGNAALEYPVGSKREMITFFIDNIRKGTGAISGVKSQTIFGDKEIQQVR